MHKDFNRYIRLAGEALQKGQVILYPTETVWGIGCDATRTEACRRILDIKGRTDHQGFIILLSSVLDLEKYVENIPDTALEFIRRTHEPLTLVFDGGKGVAPEVLGPRGTIAIRITSHPFCKKLIDFTEVPLVSTSANFSGHPSPVTHHHIDPELASRCDFIVPLPEEKPPTTRPSKIIRYTDDGGIFTIRE